MQPSVLLQSSATLLFFGVALGWELTVYRSDDQCGQTGANSIYRVYTGSGPVGCQNMLGAPTDGVSCGEYQGGGTVGPETCTDTGYEAGYRTFVATLDGSTIDLYTSPSCDNGEDPTPVDGTCQENLEDGPFDGFKVM